MTKKPVWTRDEAIELIKQIEHFCPAYGCHVALTGGLLYKEGSRKDADIMLYRIRQSDRIDTDGLFRELSKLGVEVFDGETQEEYEAWVIKARFKGKAIDFFFPEQQ